MKRNRKNYLAIDLGASNGRAVLGTMHRGTLTLKEINHFANVPVRMNNTLYWDVMSLWNNILESLRICASMGLDKLSGIGVDTWGVDFGLLGKNGKLLGNPVHYRDRRTEGIENDILRRINNKTLYRLTGLPFMSISTLSQIVALRKQGGGDTINAAKTFLMMPDLFRYFLCGKMACDHTIVGTSQLFNISSKRWCREVIRSFEIPSSILPPLIKPGKIAGPLTPGVCELTGMKHAPVIAVAGHDTPSAAAAVPCIDPDAAFVSCGTWAVLGVTSKKPLAGKDAISLGYVNEQAVESNIFVKNMMGLYLFELLHMAMNKGRQKTSYSMMVRDASAAKPFSCVLNIDDPVFFATGDVEAAIKAHLKATGQKIPGNRGAIIRALLEGLAFSCREALEQLSSSLNRKIKKLHIVGGGSRNKLLCRFIADASGMEVIAGPSEATVIGNLGIQAIAAGELENVSEIRELAASSFKLEHFKPKNTEVWNKHYRLYKKIVEK